MTPSGISGPLVKTIIFRYENNRLVYLLFLDDFRVRPDLYGKPYTGIETYQKYGVLKMPEEAYEQALHYFETALYG